MLKTIILLIILLSCLFNLSAQEESNIKLKIETGTLWDWVEGKIFISGPFLNLEPKLKTSKNTFIGLRVGFALNTQKILASDSRQFFTNNNSDNNGIISLVPTFDYYFIKNNFRPYFGLGIGYYFLTTSKKGFVVGAASNVLELSVKNQIGFLLRGGFNLHKLEIGRFDLSKFIIGLEFNFIPKADVEIPNEQLIGTIDNSYIGLSIGYAIGLGKT